MTTLVEKSSKASLKYLKLLFNCQPDVVFKRTSIFETVPHQFCMDVPTCVTQKWWKRLNTEF
jgi:hypothetical protein